VVTEAIIDAPPGVVYKAVLDEYAGAAHWGVPYKDAKIKDGSPIGVNMVSDVTVLGPMGMKGGFTFKVTKVEEGKLIYGEYLTGDFKGSEEFTFEPVDGKTRIRLKWKAQPNRLLVSLLAPMAKKIHSTNAQEEFGLLNKYVGQK
jgi:uncharacterized protein YndB with AHSA1/START domain